MGYKRYGGLQLNPLINNPCHLRQPYQLQMMLLFLFNLDNQEEKGNTNSDISVAKIALNCKPEHQKAE